ncbi:MAG: hypothetical protein ABJA79_02660 [Parafilimonas sp.]
MKKYKIQIWFLLVAVIVCNNLSAQQIPLNQQVQNRLNELFMEADSSVFTGFRSMNWLELKSLNIIHKSAVTDSVFGLDASSRADITNSNWIKASGIKSVFALDPYIEAGIANSSKKNNALTNFSGGAKMQAVFNDKFSLNADVVTNLNQFPVYIDSIIFSKNNIIPSENAATLKSNNRFTYTNFNFNLTFTPSKYFLISAGYGKQFLGDGYRSLLLSDNANNYPYIRLQARLWKLTYNVLYNRYINKSWYLVDGESQPKYSTVHYLGFSTKKFQAGLFDEIVWLAKDTNFNRGFDVQYLNPLIFMRPLEFTIGSPDNAMIGVNAKYNLYKNGFIYGQIALDDINFKASLDAHEQNYGNKYALQLGIWNKDIFTVKGLSYRFEWNGVRPYTYGHGVGNNISLNYTHYYQSLTDPFGANFHEFISLFNYENRRWYGMLENLITIRGENPGLPYNNGEDLFGGETDVPRFGSKTLQGIKTKYFFNRLSAGYLINPANRLSLQADIIYRKRSSTQVDESEFYFSIGIKTNIYNLYHDF